jgi:Xaa-Pro aminopeptidase
MALIDSLVRSGNPSPADIERWREADRLARPQRLAAFRDRLAREGVDAYFGVSPQNARYLTGIEFGEGEEKVAGNSGQFLVSATHLVVLADSRYTVQAAEQCPDARVERVYGDFFARWPELIASLDEVRRLGVEAGIVSHATWQKMTEATPDLELVAADGWVEDQRQVKEQAEIERVASACAVADAALERLLPQIRPGVTEADLALQLEWDMRTHGAEALAFDVACLSGPRAALPHGSPGPREIRAGEVLLFDFGAQVYGYRSDTTRTLFVGEPRPADLEIYRIVANAQQSAIDAVASALAAGRRPSGPEIDGAAREVIQRAGHGEHFGHGLGHGIGLATHELPGLGPRAPDAPLPSPSVFTIEPGIYLDDVTGVRIEDTMLFEAQAGRVDRLSLFPRDVTVVG